MLFRPILGGVVPYSLNREPLHAVISSGGRVRREEFCQDFGGSDLQCTKTARRMASRTADHGIGVEG